MVALSVQTLLLMAAAYFLGAMTACLIRRSLFRPAAPELAERRVDPLPDLAQRTATSFGRGAAEDERLAKPAPTAVATPSTAPVAPAATAGEAPVQDLKRIRLIDAGLEAGLNKLGVRRYEQIAGWLRADVTRIDQALGLKGRVNQENWIEQAQVLAKGGETYYSLRRARGEGATVLPTPDEGTRAALPSAPSGKRATVAAEVKPQVTLQPRPATAGAAAVAADIVMPAALAKVEAKPQPASPPPSSTPANVAERAAFAEPRRSEPTSTSAPQPPPAATSGAEPAPAVPVRPVTPSARDNLQRIGGIDAQTEQRLSAQGVTRYSQIAHWSPADVDRFDRQLAASGRIARENWVEQAQILSRGGDTAFSRDFDRRLRGEEPSATLRPAKLADAIREHAAKVPDGRASNPDLGALRSVRSEAYQNPEPGPEAAQRVVAQNKVLRSAALEDLKRIRGIGVLIEKRLNSMGVVSYEQIANWSAADIDRISQLLDFKGRIERENWVEQARILASGGATEFSRRVDRGEVETSRLKT